MTGDKSKLTDLDIGLFWNNDLMHDLREISFMDVVIKVMASLITLTSFQHFTAIGVKIV